MGMDVLVKSGEQPRYFSFGTGGNQINQTAAVAASNAMLKESPWSTYMGILVGGTTGATIQIQGTNEAATAAGTNANWVNIGSVITLTTAARAAGFADATAAPWRWVRANVTANDGTVQIIMGV